MSMCFRNILLNLDMIIPVITYKKGRDKERKTNVIIVERGNIKKVWQEVERVLNLNNIKGFKSVQDEKEYRGYFEEKTA